jgi:hypothetical protein
LIESQIETTGACLLEGAEEDGPVRRILPRMKRAPNDCKTPGVSETPDQHQLFDLPFREGRNEQQQKPQNPADEPGERRHDKPCRGAAGQHGDRGNSPAMIPRVAEARDACQQDQRRDDRDKEQDVIEIDQKRESAGERSR